MAPSGCIPCSRGDSCVRTAPHQEDAIQGSAFVRKKKNNPHQDPRASGMPANITMAPAYMGCLMIAYGPVETTF